MARFFWMYSYSSFFSRVTKDQGIIIEPNPSGLLQTRKDRRNLLFFVEHGSEHMKISLEKTISPKKMSFAHPRL